MHILNLAMVASLSLFLSTYIGATPRENQFAAGAASAALAGAGIASINSAAATYLNPANLARCNRSGFEIGLKQLSTRFDVTQRTGTSKKVKQLENLLVAEIGGCAMPLSGLGLGLWTSSGFSKPILMGLSTLNDDISFVRFGGALRAPTILAAIGYAFIPQFSLGLGVSVAMQTRINQAVFAPLSQSENPFSTTLEAEVRPRAGIIAGLSIQPHEIFGIGAIFRSANFGQFDAHANTQAEAIVKTPPITMNLHGAIDYSPRQYGLGIVYKPLPTLNLVSDINFAAWSKYPGPFLIATPDPNSATSTGITLPKVETYKFRDVFIPKVGLEFLLRKSLAVRMGYGFHPAIIEAPDQQSNLIDSPTHTISMGGGYRTQNDTLAFHTDFFVATHVMQPSQVNKNATNESYAFGGIAISSGLNAGLDF